MTAPPSEKSTVPAPAPSAGPMVSAPAPDAVRRPRRSARGTMTGPSRPLPTSASGLADGWTNGWNAAFRHLFLQGYEEPAHAFDRGIIAPCGRSGDHHSRLQ